MVTDIAQSHSTGLGGSDAKLLYAAGSKGNISTTLASRLKEIKYKKIPNYSGHTPAQLAGYDFEKIIANVVPNAKAEQELEVTILTSAFRTFAHADFYSDNSNIVYECKYSKKTLTEVKETYRAQLQWYYLMGAEGVILVYGTGNAEGGVADFKDIQMVDIAPDPKYQEIILAGLKLAVDYFNNLPDCDFDSVFATDDNLNNLIEEVSTLSQVIANFTAQLEIKKHKLMLAMIANNLTNAENDIIKVAYVAGGKSTRFDSKKFKEEKGELYDKYLTTIETKDSLRVTMRKAK